MRAGGPESQGDHTPPQASGRTPCSKSGCTGSCPTRDIVRNASLGVTTTCKVCSKPFPKLTGVKPRAVAQQGQEGNGRQDPTAKQVRKLQKECADLAAEVKLLRAAAAEVARLPQTP